MRRLRGWGLFLVGMLVGAVAVCAMLQPVPGPFGFLKWRFHGPPPEYFDPPPMAVACEDVPAGSVLEQQQTCERRLSEQCVVQDTVRPDQLPSVIGLKARKSLEAGEPLEKAFFVKPGSVEDVCARIEQAAQAGHSDQARTALEELRVKLAATGPDGH